MSDYGLAVALGFSLACVSVLIAWRVGRLVERRLPVAGVLCAVALGIAGTVLSFGAVTSVFRAWEPTCEEVFEETASRHDPDRELLARCIATAGTDEISSADVLRRHPAFYGFSLRRSFIGSP